MSAELEFRWLFVVEGGGQQEFEAAERVFKDAKVFDLKELSKKAISFSELSNVEDASEAWSQAWAVLHRLNLFLAAFLFRSVPINIGNEVYEATADGKAHLKYRTTYAISGPATLLTPIAMAQWQLVLARYDSAVSGRLRGRYKDDELFMRVLGHVAEGDVKDYYIAYETICEDIGIQDASFARLEAFSEIAQDELRAFYISANALFRHKKPRRPPPNPIDAETAKVIVLRLFVAWSEKRYPN